MSCTVDASGFHCLAQSVASASVLEASMDLVQWLPLRTNPTPNAATEFLDPEAASLVCRFYRIRQQ